MKRILAAAVLVSGMALPAHATEWMDCGDGDDKVTFRVLLGMMPVISINSIEIEAAGQKWSNTGTAGAIPVMVGQAFETADQVWIDVTDDNINRVVASLRVFKGFEDKAAEGMNADAKGGILHLPGIGVWPVSCSGP
ncbi:hypothetical protein [Aestuariivirga sp.]|uniref:hypothetical protein n=1 Tax=Aestuariivirga sp. TaxID=2650926 RepID=UPI00359459B9